MGIIKKLFRYSLLSLILVCVLSIPASAYEYSHKDFTATSFRKSWDTKKDIHLFTDYDVDCSGKFTYGFNTYFLVNNNKGLSNRSNWNSFYDATKIEIDHKKATYVE